MSLTRNLKLAFLGATSLFAIPQSAQADANADPGTKASYAWVTLGTMGGPMPSMRRAEPANLLVRPGSAVLVDCGDDAMTRLVGAGAQFAWLNTIFISHLHTDHTGGLFAVLGLRQQTHTTSPLAIYGPPGTKAMVAGIMAGLEPGAQSGYGVEGEKELSPQTGVTVIEVNDGSVVKLQDMIVRAAKNTHYTFTPGSDLDKRFASLSYRFELPDRTIVYTGDTGPSTAVEKLAKGADLLVSELIDEQATMASIKRRAVEMDPQTLAVMTKHLTTHHLTTSDVAHLASMAGVKSVVVTHIAGGGGEDAQASDRYAREIGQDFAGKVAIANDMDRF